MPTEENKVTARRYFEGSKQTVFDEFLAPDYVLHLPGLPEPIRGPEGTKRFHVPYFSAFPDFQTPVEDVVAEGDKVAVRYTARATHQGEFMGIAPTGKQVTMAGMSVLRIVGGKIVEEWAMPDFLGLLQQLGAIPRPGQGGG